MKIFKLTLFVAALAAAAVMATSNSTLPMIIVTYVLLVLATGLLVRPTARLCVPTLSVPEILMDVLDAFKASVPWLGAFSTDFSSKTAVKGDTITAHISILPTVQAYDANNGGFKNGATDVTNLLADVPVTMDQFPHVPIKVGWLSQLSSKKPLYKEAIRNYAYVLGKSMVDASLAKFLATNFHYTDAIANANVTLDYIEFVRTKLNLQKAAQLGRFGLCSSDFAAALQNDDRVKSSLFYGQLNGNEGYRHFRNIAGFGNVWEYPDFPTNGENLSAFFGDPRSAVIASRRPDFSNVAAELGVPQVMQFYPIEDPETGLFMTGVAWQEVGTGDVYVSAAILYGVSAGKQGGANDAITDKAGFRVTTQ